MILFIESSRAAAAAHLGESGDKVIMRGVRASRPFCGSRLVRDRARNRQHHFATGGFDSLHDTRAVAPPPHDRFACYTFSKMCLSRIMCRGEALPSCARLERTRVTVPTEPYGVLR